MSNGQTLVFGWQMKPGQPLWGGFGHQQRRKNLILHKELARRLESRMLPR